MWPVIINRSPNPVLKGLGYLYSHTIKMLYLVIVSSYIFSNDESLEILLTISKNSIVY